MKDNRQPNYGPIDKFKYHWNRLNNPEKCGIKKNSTEQSYSRGFANAFQNSVGWGFEKQRRGAKNAAAYSSGQRRGYMAAKTFKAKLMSIFGGRKNYRNGR